jgi:ribosomal protein L40E
MRKRRGNSNRLTHNIKGSRGARHKRYARSPMKFTSTLNQRNLKNITPKRYPRFNSSIDRKSAQTTIYNRSTYNSSRTRANQKAEEKNLSSNQARTQTIDSEYIDANVFNTEIEQLKQKINEKIKQRKHFISENIRRDDKCFHINEEKLIELKNEFIEYLVEKSKANILKKRKLKSQLQNLRFNLEEGNEDILIQERDSFFGSKSIKSLIKLPSAKWDEWYVLIEMVGKNMKSYKLSLKRKELKKLHDKYQKISQEKPKTQKKICEKCGAENSSEGIYCHYCGNKL